LIHPYAAGLGVVKQHCLQIRGSRFKVPSSTSRTLNIEP
jgi:hypothetical protein